MVMKKPMRGRLCVGMGSARLARLLCDPIIPLPRMFRVPLRDVVHLCAAGTRAVLGLENVLIGKSGRMI
jgi:hypothetical protein